THTALESNFVARSTPITYRPLRPGSTGQSPRVTHRRRFASVTRWSSAWVHRFSQSLPNVPSESRARSPSIVAGSIHGATEWSSDGRHRGLAAAVSYSFREKWLGLPAVLITITRHPGTFGQLVLTAS